MDGVILSMIHGSIINKGDFAMAIMILFVLVSVMLSGVSLYQFYGSNDINASMGYFIAAVMSLTCYLILLSEHYKDMQIQAQKRQIELHKTLIALFEKENDRLRGIRK